MKTCYNKFYLDFTTSKLVACQQCHSLRFSFRATLIDDPQSGIPPPYPKAPFRRIVCHIARQKSQEKPWASSRVSSLKAGTLQRRILPQLRNSLGHVLL